MDECVLDVDTDNPVMTLDQQIEPKRFFNTDRDHIRILSNASDGRLVYESDRKCTITRQMRAGDCEAYEAESVIGEVPYIRYQGGVVYRVCDLDSEFKVSNCFLCDSDLFMFRINLEDDYLFVDTNVALQKRSLPTYEVIETMPYELMSHNTELSSLMDVDRSGPGRLFFFEVESESADGLQPKRICVIENVIGCGATGMTRREVKMPGFEFVEFIHCALDSVRGLLYVIGFAAQKSREVAAVVFALDVQTYAVKWCIFSANEPGVDIADEVGEHWPGVCVRIDADLNDVVELHDEDCISGQDFVYGRFLAIVTEKLCVFTVDCVTQRCRKHVVPTSAVAKDWHALGMYMFSAHGHDGYVAAYGTRRVSSRRSTTVSCVFPCTFRMCSNSLSMQYLFLGFFGPNTSPAAKQRHATNEGSALVRVSKSMERIADARALALIASYL